MESTAIKEQKRVATEIIIPDAGRDYPLIPENIGHVLTRVLKCRI